MERRLEELYLVPLGALALAEERLKVICERLSKKGREKEKEIRKNLLRIRERSFVSELEKKTKTFAEKLLEELGVPKRDEILEIKKELEEIKDILRDAGSSGRKAD